MSDIHLKVKQLVELKRLRQREFAELIGRTEQTVRNYFSGRTKIDIDVIQNIANVLEVPVSYFFEENADLSKKIIGDNNKVNIDSNNHNVNPQSSQETYKSEVSDLKERIKELQRLNVYYWDLTENLINIITQVYVKLSEKSPENKNFLKELEETSRFIATFNTIMRLADKNVLYNKKFFDYFENPY